MRVEQSAFLIGVVTGLRTFTGVTAVSWAAREGTLPLANTKLAFLGYAATPYVLSALAATELVTDKLPSTPSRTVPVQFGARIAMGGFSGFAIGAANDEPVAGLIAGLVGSVVGTLGGAKLRAVLAKSFHHDLPAAVLEDAFAGTMATGVVRLLQD